MGLFSAKRGRVVWADATVPDELVNYHFFAAGSTGSGKTTLLRILMRGILPDVRTKDLDTRFLIYDAKTEVYPDLAALGQQTNTIILNPFDARCHAWDMGRDIQDEAQAQELAALMVPPGDGQNKYFYDASRMLLKVAAQSLVKLRGVNWDFRDLLLACANVEELKVLVERAKLPAVAAVADFLTKAKEAKSVRMTLAVENSSYNVIAAAWHRTRLAGRSFSVHDWVSGAGPQIILLGSAKIARTALATVNRLVLQRLQQVLLNYTAKDARSGRRSWVFLDEFPTLGSIPHLEEFLTEGRSRGVCCVLGFVSVHGVEA